MNRDIGDKDSTYVIVYDPLQTGHVVQTCIMPNFQLEWLTRDITSTVYLPHNQSTVEIYNLVAKRQKAISTNLNIKGLIMGCGQGHILHLLLFSE